ncbi:2-octaprenyl-6-methoxyphenyl hydroxylase [Parahaliea maris]|uniref:2-octaprenyl-6-methoxyphenyl hydroxylase n=1 Tax=Parahaliea maris TaxID=2716870 RepID=A0A5C8ZZC5_9GAMM|nr:2-octaprenyl-6-methoxyphenyl hydroxylase [Parahaliea maris]TXS93935.1 2-octaprenyl-6-methoxyphenyl hydroxylase [Parahaliea maris]
MSEQRDILIAGGGMVGISLALQLAVRLPDTVRITLVEGYPFPEQGVAPGHPSFDARSTALSYSSRLLYEQSGQWQDLAAQACAIETIHVSRRGRFGSAVLRAEEHGWPALGYVVENALLGHSLAQALLRQGRVEVVSPARVTAVEPDRAGTLVQLEGAGQSCLHTRLLVVADGADSSLRESLGVAVADKPYGQHALIANVAFAEPHRGCAYERFTASGPLALLPLVPIAGASNRSALVWALSPERAAELKASNEDDFLEALQEAYGYRLGRFLRAGERHTYPLSRREAQEQVRRGVVVMGNAAHTLHPVAGQGFNLALRDVARLAAVLSEVGDGDYGALDPLQRYQRAQQADQQRTIGASDLLPELFMHSDPLLGMARDLALSGLDVTPRLKREFVRYAAGVAALDGQSGEAL